jgi:F-type H+-transporting ATPase subunit b
MGFLGSLGIDMNLLIAQLINFGLLLWLLAKFLYKPIVSRIEEDERKLERVKKKEEELEREKKAFLNAREKEIVEAKQHALEIVKEAEKVADEIKKQASKESEKKIRAMITQTRRNLHFRRLAMESKLIRDLRLKVAEDFQRSFKEGISVLPQKELQEVFFKGFISQINSLPLKKPEESGISDIIKEMDFALKKERNEEYKRLEEKLAERIGPAVLEYAFPLSSKQQEKFEKLERAISKRIGINEKIVKKWRIIRKQNRGLISGFRFEVMGMIVESNFLSIIRNAFDFKK